ncbi:MAG: polysaccharide biosynthesis protein [Magnetococcales bacterium]|nr:polysaccharide biosynthesis protein [Magnetococcales bacterium]
MAQGYLAHYGGKRVLITGACGTVGLMLVHALLKSEVGSLIALDNDEKRIFDLYQTHRANTAFDVHLGDIRNADEVFRVMQEVDIVLHGAAFKHVPICELSPFEAVQTNIIGVENIVKSAIRQGVRQVLFMSSDKAVNPTNVMGATKLMGERLITAANSGLGRRGGETALFSTRFGNVLGSRGSVLPLFMEQIRRGHPLTLTHSRMTRFVMTPEQAAELVLKSAALARGGEVFVTKMAAILLADLARALIELTVPLHGRDPDDYPIELIGPRPGEKLYEELLNEEELRRVVELRDHFVVLPPMWSAELRRDYCQQQGADPQQITDKPYRSDLEPPMSVEQIKDFLRTWNLLAPLSAPTDAG